MSKIIIERNSEWNNRLRKIGLYVDGIKVGTIESGETIKFNVESGTHQLKAKIDWCGSNLLKLDLNEDEIKTVKLSGFKYGSVLLPAVFLLLIAIIFLNMFWI